MPDWEQRVDFFDRMGGAEPFAALLRELVDLAGVRAGLRVADVGCGPGRLLGVCRDRGARTVAVDLSPGMVRRALDRGRAELGSVGSALALPLRDGCLDRVFATNVVFLVPEPAAAIAELRRVLAPGGRVALLNPSTRMSFASMSDFLAREGITDPDAVASLTGWSNAATRNRPFTPTSLTHALEAAGFRTIELHERFDGLALLATADRA